MSTVGRRVGATVERGGGRAHRPVAVEAAGVRTKLKPPGEVDLPCQRFGLVWFGLVWFGLVWFGLSCKAPCPTALGALGATHFPAGAGLRARADRALGASN